MYGAPIGCLLSVQRHILASNGQWRATWEYIAWPIELAESFAVSLTVLPIKRGPNNLTAQARRGGGGGVLPILTSKKMPQKNQKFKKFF